MNGEREWQRAVRRAALRRGSQSERGQRDRPVRLARGGVTRRELHALRPRVGNGVLRRLAADEEFVAPERVERAVESEKGGGRPLEQTVRGPMEVALGADLSDVRVHDDARAAGLNQDLSARAFTHGSDIFLQPVSTGFITPTSMPRFISVAASIAATKVFPTPVSVPVIKTPVSTIYFNTSRIDLSTASTSISTCSALIHNGGFNTSTSPSGLTMILY